MGNVAVIDIGKTNAKLLLIDSASGRETASVRVPNRVLRDGPYPHFDIEALWAFLLEHLGRFGAGPGFEAISITTHGATAALVDAAGDLVLPVLDYEHDGPDGLPGYDAIRPPFSETGSPRLPAGLNLGAQIWWQSQCFPAEFARVCHVLTYPQYWAMRLTGVASSEVTSLGCHTDLWNPWQGRFSSLVRAAGWQDLFPPLRPAAFAAPIRPEIARRLGLPVGLPVHSGIHDSNASLLPYLAMGDAPFAVVSTGTWMIVMAMGGAAVALDPARDALVNVNARGQPTPTARFMAGREFDEITGGAPPVAPTAEDRRAVLQGGVMAQPSLHPGTGPFPGLEFSWTQAPTTLGARCLAASWYIALVGAECLRLVGAEGAIHVEGPLGGNPDFLSMLATAAGRPVIAAGAGSGTGGGAALLAGPGAAERAEGAPVAPDPTLRAYATAWRARVAGLWTARSA